MATVKFYIRSKKNPTNIYVRLTINRENYFRRKTNYFIDPYYWNAKKGMPKNSEIEFKNLGIKLEKLATGIKENYNDAVEKGVDLSNEWLQEQINIIQGKVKITDSHRLTNCIQEYIDYLPRKIKRDGTRSVALSTIKKYRTLKVKIEEFEKYSKKKIVVKDVGLKFIDELDNYFTKVDGLNGNTTGRYIKFVKTVCIWAGKKGIVTNSQLKEIKGFTVNAPKVVLSFDELEKIENTSFERDSLKNAADWLIIGCYIGQRVSDLLTLTKNNIIIKNGVEFIELTQKKTGKYVLIPLHYKVNEILNKRNGDFPYYISDVKFNIHLKDVCRLSGIDEPIEGGKMVKNETTKKTRKIFGTFPKHELISSHVCRRSYATNFYGEMPTSWLITITAHSTEKQFLEYVGKPAIDTAQQIAEFFAKQASMAKKEPQMTIISKAKNY